jgi:hypothetical protein
MGKLQYNSNGRPIIAASGKPFAKCCCDDCFCIPEQICYSIDVPLCPILNQSIVFNLNFCDYAGIEYQSPTVTYAAGGTRFSTLTYDVPDPFFGWYNAALYVNTESCYPGVQSDAQIFLPVPGYNSGNRCGFAKANIAGTLRWYFPPTLCDCSGADLPCTVTVSGGPCT